MRIRMGFVRVYALSCVAALALSACGGTRASGGAEAGSTATATAPSAQLNNGLRPFPQLRNIDASLPGGTYATSTFSDPKLAMTLPGQWTFTDQGPTDLQITEGPKARLESTLVVFDFFGRVIDPSNDHTITTTNDVIAWIEKNPHLGGSKRATQVRIGGAAGREIDFTTVGAPACRYYSDGSRCWNLMPMIDGDPFTPANMELGMMWVAGSSPESPAVSFSYRLAVAEFQGRQVLFTWQDSPSEFDQTVKTFEQVLISIRAS